MPADGRWDLTRRLKGQHTFLFYNKTANVRINVISRRARVTTVAVENKYYICCVCIFVALVIQRAVRMRCIVICGLSDCRARSEPGGTR